jgi:hypothetical protein
VGVLGSADSIFVVVNTLATFGYNRTMFAVISLGPCDCIEIAIAVIGVLCYLANKFDKGAPRSDPPKFS